MENTLNFSVFKEKIIKTNELLNVVVEKNRCLEESQKWNKHLKTKLELSKNEANKLKLRNETLTYNLASVEKHCDVLKNENNKLKEQLNKLEDESNNTINNLQVNYQLTNQELKACKERLSLLNDFNADEKSPTKRTRKKSPQRKKENFELIAISKKVGDLQAEKEKLISEKSDLRLEVYELKKKLSSLQYLQESFERENLAIKEKDKEMTRIATENENNLQVINKLSKEIKTLGHQRDQLQTDNEKLKDENCSYQLEISILQENSALSKEKILTVKPLEAEDLPPENTYSPDNNETPTDEEVCAILQQMNTPLRISPLMEEGSPDKRNLATFGQIIDKFPSSPVNSSHNEINKDLKWVVNRRRTLLKKRRQIARKKLAQVDLYGALLALKKAKINFIISNSSLAPSCESLNHYYTKNAKLKHIRKKKEHFEREKLQTVTKELNCSLPCCKSVYMVLKESGDNQNPALIGFVGVKNETPHSDQSQNTLGKYKKEDMSILSLKTKPREPHMEAGKSKRKLNCVTSVIKKRKMGTRTCSTVTEVITPCLDDSSVENATTFVCDNSNDTPQDDFVFKKPEPITQEPALKISFKRPVCSTRRFTRLSVMKEPTKNCQQEQNLPLESPKSPTPDKESSVNNIPIIIPLERTPENVEKMPTTKIEMLFNKLILYSMEEEVLNEVVKEFAFQDPEYIAQAILARVALDYHDRADTKYSPAPLMTHVQRTMLGFMSKLEKSTGVGVFDNYLMLAEQRLLICHNLDEFGPITRLYIAICKLRKNLTRMRKLCCDVFYFCGDFAMPFLFTVLTSWIKVLPLAQDSKDFPIARVLVQIVHTLDCNKPGYNLMPLRDLLTKYYGYPSERWDFNEFFTELFNEYLKKPSRSTDFAVLLYCKSRPEKWVYEKIEELFKPLIKMDIQNNFKATLIILIGNLYNRFSSSSETNYLPTIREWFLSLVKDETPDVVKKSVYVSLSRLKKK